MQDIYSIPIWIVFLILGVPIGNILAKNTPEELKDGRKWFLIIIFLSLLGDIINLIFKNDVLMFTFLFIAIVFFQKFSHLVFSLPTMSIFLLVFSDKVTSGLKASVLYSYQTSLCSRKYALSQTTIMTSLELFTSYLFLQPFSGSFVDYLGWNRFYLISTLITLLPLLMQWTIVDKKSVGG